MDTIQLQRKRKRALAAATFDEPLELLNANLTRFPRRSTLLRRSLAVRRTKARQRAARDEEQRVMGMILRALRGETLEDEVDEPRGVDELTGGLYEVEESDSEDEGERVRKAATAPGTGAPRDVLAEFPDLRAFRSPTAIPGERLHAKLRMYAQDLNMPLGIVVFCADLAQASTYEQLRGAGRRWSRREFLEHLIDPNTRLVVAHEAGTVEPLAFASFCFCEEDGAAVLLLHELHVVESARRRGLGAHVVKLLEKVAAFHKMDRITLSYMRGTRAPRAFCAALGYAEGLASPAASPHRTRVSKSL